MRFNKHLELEGRHAFLSASQSSWVNYDDDQLVSSYRSHLAAMHGTRLHDFAKRAIDLRQYLAETKQTLNMYVNDCIRDRMTTEQVLFATPNAFGTADAIKFDKDTRHLDIRDLKTGVKPAGFRQLKVYVAFFCIEYDWDPNAITIELRIYQNDEVLIEVPDPHEIMVIIDQIMKLDDIVESLNEEFKV